MNRGKRIRVVIVAGVGLLALLIALVGAPLLAMALLPKKTPLGGYDFGNVGFESQFRQMVEVARIANLVSLVSLAVASVCLLYLLVTLAAWFIGPKQATDDGSQSC